IWHDEPISRGSCRVGSANFTWASTTNPRGRGGARAVCTAVALAAAVLFASPSPLLAGSYLQRDLAPQDSSSGALVVETSPPGLLRFSGRGDPDSSRGRVPGRESLPSRGDGPRGFRLRRILAVRLAGTGRHRLGIASPHRGDAPSCAAACSGLSQTLDAMEPRRRRRGPDGSRSALPAARGRLVSAVRAILRPARPR